MYKQELILKEMTRREKDFRGEGQKEVLCYKVTERTNMIEPPIGKILSHREMVNWVGDAKQPDNKLTIQIF